MLLLARPFALPCLLTVVVGVASVAFPVSAQVKRCERTDGSMVFTDKPCDTLGAREQLAREPAGSRNRLYRGCARSVEELIFEITAAIDAGDANRLASVYHWPGMSSSVGYQVLGTLDAIVKRPLVDITPLTSDNLLDDAYASAATPAAESADMHSADAAGEPAPAPMASPQQAGTRQPIALRLDQTLSDSATPSQTRFTLVRNLDCWWIEH